MSSAVADRKIPFLRYLNRLMFGVSLAGILDTVHLLVQEKYGFNKGCLSFVDTAIERSFNCQQVVSSDAGHLLGVSNTMWGIIFYTAVSILLFLRFTPLKKANRLINGIITGLLSFAFIYTLYLLYYQSFVLSEYCLLCLISAFLTFLLFFGEWTRFYYLERYAYSSLSRRESQPVSYEEFWRSVIWIGVIAVAITDIGLAQYQTITKKIKSSAASSQVSNQSLILRDARSISLPASEPTQCKYEAGAKGTISRSLTSFYDPIWGEPTSEISLVFYFDPLDPTTIPMLDMLKQLYRQSSRKLSISFKPIPLNTKSVPVVLSLYQAHRQNSFFSYLRALHHTQSDSINRRIHKAADRSGVSISSASSDKTAVLIRNRLLMEVQKARSSGIDHFPTLIINRKEVDEQSLTKACLRKFAEKTS